MSELHELAPAAPAAAAVLATKPVASPGARLRAERERRGLGIQQVTEALHVDARLVEAMENDRFAAFDAPVYARGFLRKYAGWLELPDAELLGAYEQLHVGPGTPSLIPATSAMPRLHDLRALPIVLAAVAALLLVGSSLWWWLARTPAARPAATVAAAAPATAAPAAPAAASAAPAVATAGAADAAAGAAGAAVAGAAAATVAAGLAAGVRASHHHSELPTSSSAATAASTIGSARRSCRRGIAEVAGIRLGVPGPTCSCS